MAQTSTTEKKLSARKRPSQQRSQKMVQRILDATRELLRDTGRADAPRLTTNHIAKKARISVGSLYQYFPNLEAILFELYGEILARVSNVLDEFDSVTYLSMPRDEFFAKLNRALADAGPDEDIVLAMMNAVRSYSMLKDAERKHAEHTSKRIAALLKHFGSTWSAIKLQRLVLYVYYIDHGGWMYREHVKPPKKETLEWEVSAVNFMMMKCFEETSESG